MNINGFGQVPLTSPDVSVTPVATPRAHRRARRAALSPASCPRVLPWYETGRTRKLPNEQAIEPLHGQLYMHGAGMGLTRSLLQNPAWRALLHKYTPDTAARVEAILKKDPSMVGPNLALLMSVVENSPVLAAYATWRAAPQRPAMEWDLWLDPKQPTDLTRARIIHGNRRAGDLARHEDARLDDITHRRVDGSDVHLGLDPVTWMRIYEDCSRTVNPQRQPSKLPLYLDVKSTLSSSADIGAFIAAAQARLPVQVRGVGSFKLSQLASLESYETIYLFDTPAEVAQAQAAGRLPRGAIVMFNAGCLLAPRAGGSDRWRIDAAQMRLLRQAQSAGGLRLTTYIQETVASPEALNTVFRLINTARRADKRHVRMFIKVAYGNLNGRAEKGASGPGVVMQFAPSTETGK